MKVLLIGMLLASPPVAAWMLRTEAPAALSAGIQPVSQPFRPTPAGGPIQVPVEVVAEGSAPQWVYVEVQNQAVPEPGVVSWLVPASLLLLRRQRPAGK